MCREPSPELRRDLGQVCGRERALRQDEGGGRAHTELMQRGEREEAVREVLQRHAVRVADVVYLFVQPAQWGRKTPTNDELTELLAKLINITKWHKNQNEKFLLSSLTTLFLLPHAPPRRRRPPPPARFLRFPLVVRASLCEHVCGR